MKPLEIQELDATGSGDSFVAGLVNCWINSDLFEDSLKFATAIAGLNASTFDVSNVSLEDVIKFKDKVEILPVGKKQRQSMIRLAKFSLVIILFISSFSSAQKLSSFEVNGNFNFDDSEYFKLVAAPNKPAYLQWNT
ncbi:MAG: PfkB family carbohydrate kinase [Ignavibacteriales bacterium]|nr:PfkB family carbohydrate kinase [Ignavibacteriales bacterium]